MQSIHKYDPNIIKALSAATLVFWDFDGVIKDSISVKTEAYANLFSKYGSDVVGRIREHHEQNGGISRFEKIPLYLVWAGLEATPNQVGKFCDKFSGLVLKAVIDSPWVPGVREYLEQYFRCQYFVLLTATPQEEIEIILAKLKLAHCFREVYGSPTKKGEAVNTVLSSRHHALTKSLMIGDAQTDLNAARMNSVPFLLRRTPFNLSVQSAYSGLTFDHLNYE